MSNWHTFHCTNDFPRTGFEVHIFVKNTFNHVFNCFSLTKVQDRFFANITFLELLVFMHRRNMIIQLSSACVTYKGHFSFMNCFYMHFQIAATHKSCTACSAAKRLVFFMNFPYVSIQVTFSWKQGITIWTLVRFFLIMNKIAMIFQG